MEEALEWWDNLTIQESIDIEKHFGYYGHDIGTTEDDILFFYTEINKSSSDNIKL